MIFADVIMPFTAVYLGWIYFFPVTVLALASELIVFRTAYRNISFSAIVGRTLAANAVSFLLGAVVAGLLEGIIEGMKGGFFSGSDRGYLYYMIMGVLFALVVSIYIELRVWQEMTPKDSLPSLDITCAIANVVSYTLLVGSVLVFFR